MDNKIALLIDCDNIGFKLIDPVLKELEQYGEIIIKRAYGNWRNDSLKNWVTKLTELSIKPIHQIDYTKGKNATDMAIVIDAMDLMHLKKVNAFAIVSSDSDFTPLTMKLQEEGFKVYGFGAAQTPTSLKNSCSVFTDISSLLEPSAQTTKDTPNKNVLNRLNKTTLKEKCLTIFNIESPSNEYVSLEKMNRLLKEQNIDFKNYGFKQLKVFIDDLNLFQIQVNEKNQSFLKLKNLPQNQDKTETIFDQESLKKVLSESYHALSKEKKEVNMSTYFNFLATKHSFSHKSYGFATFKEFMNSTHLFDFVLIEEQPYIFLKAA
jgi:uncharacterized protein (TIGR00288 family)